MTRVAELQKQFEDLARAATASGDGLIERTSNNGEDAVRYTSLSEDGAATACLWAREHVGGLVDLEVVDGAGQQVLWRHLEGPTSDALVACWDEMMAAYRRLARRT
jgi:hypothetical protein